MAIARTFCFFVLSIPAIFWHNQAAMILMRRAERGCGDDQGTSPSLVRRYRGKKGERPDEQKGGEEMTKGRARAW
jgi:hypothetical protein